MDYLQLATSFETAAVDSAQHLIARGFARSALKHSFKLFLDKKFDGTHQQKRDLDTRFHIWLTKQDFRNAQERQHSLQKQCSAFKTEARGLLVCGLDAANAILQHVQRQILTRTQIDDININLEQEERDLNPDNPPLNAYDLRGNYPVDVLLTTISIYGDLQYKRWRNSTDTIEGHMLLLNRGSHWAAALKKEKDEASRWKTKTHPGHPRLP